MENSLTLIFMTVMISNFVAEFGDKTQLLLVGMTSKYKMRDIFLGTFAAVLVLNGIAVFAGSLLNEVLKRWLWVVKICAAAAFAYFAFSSLFAVNEDEDEEKASKFSFAPLAVFCTFFIAELGDKTQLTAVTFGASYGLKMAVLITLACSAGFFAADMLGILLGNFINKHISKRKMNFISFALFAFFAVFTLFQGIMLFLKK